MISRIKAIPGLLAIRIVISITAIVAGASFCLGPAKWHEVPSFYYVNLLHVPWWAYGLYLVVAGLLTLHHKTRPLGYFMGAVLYSFFAIAIWLATLGGVSHGLLFFHLPGGQANVFAPCNVTVVAVLYWVAARWALYDHIDPDRRAL